MVDGISSIPNPSISSTTNQRNKSSVEPVVTSESTKKTGETADSAVVVEVSEESVARNNVEKKVAQVNQAAAGAEAPTTQELASALNADTVTVALGNTVDIKA